MKFWRKRGFLERINIEYTCTGYGSRTVQVRFRAKGTEAFNEFGVISKKIDVEIRII